MELVQSFNAYAQKYPVVAGAFSLWMLAVITFLCKVIPQKIYEFLAKHLTTNLVIMNSTEGFFLLLKWMDEQGYAKKARSIKMTNGMWGRGELTKSIGYGVHYFRIGMKFVRIYLYTEKTNDRTEKDVILMTSLGRSHAVFDGIFQQIKNREYDKDNMVIFRYTDYWMRSHEQKYRGFETIYLKSGQKESIIKHIELFRGREKHGMTRTVFLIKPAFFSMVRQELVKRASFALSQNILN